MRHKNWFQNPRVRVDQIFARYPDAINVGVSRWDKVSNDPIIENLLKSANKTIKELLSLKWSIIKYSLYLFPEIVLN